MHPPSKKKYWVLAPESQLMCLELIISPLERLVVTLNDRASPKSKLEVQG